MRTIAILSILLAGITAFSAWNLNQIERSALRSSQFDSFDYVWRRVNFQKWYPEEVGRPNPLPAYTGVDTDDLIELLINNAFGRDADLSDDWAFAKRTRELFTNAANFNPEAKTKWLHPRGACVSGTWTIPADSPSEATGLFAPGTQVPMIMRISSGTHASERLDSEGEIQHRLFGLAIKLFHQTDKSKKAITSNIVTLDHRGFSRTDRPFSLIEKTGEELYYTNFAPVESVFGADSFLQTAAGHLLSNALDMFDDPNFARPVYVTAGYDQNGIAVENPAVPFELRFVPKFDEPSEVPEDFRYELMDYTDGAFDIYIQRMNESDTPSPVLIGEITFDFPMIVTGVCDRMLSFHHSPVQWKEAYENKELAIDQLDE